MHTIGTWQEIVEVSLCGAQFSLEIFISQISLRQCIINSRHNVSSRNHVGVYQIVRADVCHDFNSFADITRVCRVDTKREPTREDYNLIYDELSSACGAYSFNSIADSVLRLCMVNRKTTYSLLNEHCKLLLSLNCTFQFRSFILMNERINLFHFIL